MIASMLRDSQKALPYDRTLSISVTAVSVLAWGVMLRKLLALDASVGSMNCGYRAASGPLFRHLRPRGYRRDHLLTALTGRIL